jgi:basic amino acid/polyamine antiporter, APA family
VFARLARTTEWVSMQRVVGLPGAIMMGLGSILGTGVFLSLGLAAGLAGPSMIAGLFLAGLLAFCNGLATAQLAAAYPVSGGTYEYGYRVVHPWFGFAAGWLFVCAKSASAATAAIGFGGYFLRLLQESNAAPWQVGAALVVILTVLCLFGMKRSSVVNAVIVSVTLLALVSFVFVISGSMQSTHWAGLETDALSMFASPNFWEATALLFVAYTGYGRIATLGEEIKDPARNIPKAIFLTLLVSFLLYLAVAFVAIGAVGAEAFYDATQRNAAPLQIVAEATNHPLTGRLLGIGAMTAMAGVLLNLILGVSRMVYAMAQRSDLPKGLAELESKHGTPYKSVLVTGFVIFALVLVRDVKTTWSFSAFTVLVYYSVTNLSALRLPETQRLYPKWISYVGLVGCLGLSAWVQPIVVAVGLGLLAVGFLVRIYFRRVSALSSL